MSAVPTDPHRIDVHAHYLAPAYLDALRHEHPLANGRTPRRMAFPDALHVALRYPASATWEGTTLWILSTSS
jgi:hypothetical protein